MIFKKALVKNKSLIASAKYLQLVKRHTGSSLVITLSLDNTIIANFNLDQKEQAIASLAPRAIARFDSELSSLRERYGYQAPQ